MDQYTRRPNLKIIVVNHHVLNALTVSNEPARLTGVICVDSSELCASRGSFLRHSYCDGVRRRSRGRSGQAGYLLMGQIS